ncbi:thiol:disulfide interchange protein DsbA/DsbL [Pseudidiomarina woesei]|uniref:Thiol:disulfide interchange protein n=1 Tax=Pseudidiomarina woesei TaxID=1381080 RepID=A0A0K6HDA0_9GAMM|nr:thiol:disulfide interchange protein DsbA/DsbL [Pseudidiomarina woesei]CUA88813.1 Thioredoxin [Pseudidiomarina woesei]
MKTLLIGFLALLVMPLSAQANEEKFKEGVHYKVIAEEGTKRPEVREFFSYYCIHCYRFEVVAAAMKEAYPTSFEKSHIVSHPTLRLMARGMVAAKLFKKEEPIGKAFYQRIHDQKKQITSEEDLQAIFHVHGIEAEKFEKAMSHPLVEKQVNEMERNMNKYNIKATPTFIVNGKYEIITSGFNGSKDVVADLVEAAGYLMKK